jgi:hypothetical protein
MTDLEGSYRGLIEMLSQHFARRTDNIEERNQYNRWCGRDANRTLLNMSLECYRHVSLLGPRHFCDRGAGENLRCASAGGEAVGGFRCVRLTCT